MLNDRFLKANPEDPAVGKLKAEHKTSLNWLKDYFGVDPLNKDNALTIIRDKTAFHYDKLNLEQAVNHLADRENTVYLAQHPASSLYYVGSALVFRAAFAMIADKAQDPTGRTHGERTSEGARIATEHAQHGKLAPPFGALRLNRKPLGGNARASAQHARTGSHQHR